MDGGGLGGCSTITYSIGGKSRPRRSIGALRSDTLRRAMVSVGRRLHFNVTQLRRIADGRNALKREQIKEIDEEAALTRGSDFLAEMVVYGVSISCVGLEQWYSARKARKAAAEEEAREERVRMQQQATERPPQQRRLWT